MSLVAKMQSQQAGLAKNGDPHLSQFALKPSRVFVRLLRIIQSPAIGFMEKLHEGLPDPLIFNQF